MNEYWTGPFILYNPFKPSKMVMFKDNDNLTQRKYYQDSALRKVQIVSLCLEIHFGPIIESICYLSSILKGR